MRQLFLFILLTSLPFLVEAKQKICLNMIVKDESKVIKRCLDSVKPVIDYWVIVDTGSSDNTKEIIKAHLKDIPGKLYERPWKNFGESRSEAYDLARGKGDYILFMDADDTLEFEKDFKFPHLDKDMYCMVRGTKDFSYLKPQLVKGDLPWRWVGVTHEYLDCNNQYYTVENLENVKYVSGDGGARSTDPEKFLKNVKLLTDGLKKETNNSRYVFYLAESYHDAGQQGNALEWYQKRVAMGGWAEEVFWSKLRIAHLLKYMGLPPNIVAESYLDAHNYRPHRLEPIYYLAEFYNNNQEYSKAYSLLKKAESIPKPPVRDLLFIEDWIENYGLLMQRSVCSFYIGNYQESLDCCKKLLAMENLPAASRNLTVANMKYPLEKLQSKSIK